MAVALTAVVATGWPALTTLSRLELLPNIGSRLGAMTERSHRPGDRSQNCVLAQNTSDGFKLSGLAELF
jgi:hypothetical protein